MSATIRPDRVSGTSRAQTGFDVSPDGEDLAPSEIVNRLLDHAIAIGASDLFLSTADGAVVASVRLLGVIQTLGRLDAERGRHCIAHVRAEASLDISEHRRPQDGRCRHRTALGKVVDLRVCSLPTLFGEDLAVRILDGSDATRRFDELGLAPGDRERLKAMLACPGGLILVTGPTGSGKTTTLYACLNHLNDGTRRIHTIEDPVEYSLPEYHQSQPHAKLGLHFPDLLRGIIRQGPDVLMIGEIRDAETAQTAVTAANSGHLVLATLHAATAAGGVASMLAHGVAPHFLATSLLGIVSQRLVRTFCPGCRFPVEVQGEGEGAADDAPPRYAALGCGACHGTGFSARTGLFEVLTVTPGVRELIRASEPSQVIAGRAYREGTTSFRRAAELLITRGDTDADEVRRCVPPECLSGEAGA